MREADDAAVRRSQVFVDTRDGAIKEAGYIVEPIARGVLAPDQIIAGLIELSRHDGRLPRAATAITFFKSVGSALSDLGAAQLVVSRLQRSPPPAAAWGAWNWTRDHEYRTGT